MGNGVVVAGAQGPGRRYQLVELLVFLFLVMPAVMLVLAPRSLEELSFGELASGQIVRNLVLFVVVLYLVRRSGEPLGSIGLGRVRWSAEAGVGLLLFLPVFLAAGLLESALRSAGLSGLDATPAFLVPDGIPELLLALLFLAVVALSEEVVFRGYLIRRLQGVTGSLVVAVLISTTLFALGHGYQGTAGLITVGFLGLAFAIIYLWRGSLIAPITMHFVQNFIGVVVVPLAAAPG